MPRTGVEKKPPWRAVPAKLRELIGKELGSPVVRGVRVWGSYGPGPSFRLLLADGRRAFAKALWPESNGFQRMAFPREVRNYRDLSGLIGPWAPGFLGEAKHGEWHALMLEGLGPKTAPPWRPTDARAAARGLAEFHATMEAAEFPSWLPPISDYGLADRFAWRSLADETSLQSLANCSEQPAEALAWLDKNLPRLTAAAESLPDPADASTMVHMDVRSDNLRVVNGQLKMFDWPFAGIGPAELEAFAFAQTVEAEDGPSTEAVLQWYRDVHRLDLDHLLASAAVVSGFFAQRSPEPDIPELPRIRPWQRAQLKVSLRLAAEWLGLDEPRWVESVG